MKNLVLLPNLKAPIQNIPKAFNPRDIKIALLLCKDQRYDRNLFICKNYTGAGTTAIGSREMISALLTPIPLNIIYPGWLPQIPS